MISREKKSLDKLRVEFRMILNPIDEYDIDIINYIYLPEEGKELEHGEGFIEQIALLLKHDWERVKLEAGPLVMRVEFIRYLIDRVTYKPIRIKYNKRS